MEELQDVQLVKLMVIIAERKKGKKVVKILDENEVRFQHAILGHGTAPSEFAYYAGLGEQEKVVIISLVRPKKIKPVFDRLEKELDFGRGGGIAFTTCLNSASSKDAVHFLTGILKSGAED